MMQASDQQQQDNNNNNNNKQLVDATTTGLWFVDVLTMDENMFKVQPCYEHKGNTAAQTKGLRPETGQWEEPIFFMQDCIITKVGPMKGYDDSISMTVHPLNPDYEPKLKKLNELRMMEPLELYDPTNKKCAFFARPEEKETRIKAYRGFYGPAGSGTNAKGQPSSWDWSVNFGLDFDKQSKRLTTDLFRMDESKITDYKTISDKSRAKIVTFKLKPYYFDGKKGAWGQKARIFKTEGIEEPLNNIKPSTVSLASLYKAPVATLPILSDEELMAQVDAANAATAQYEATKKRKQMASSSSSSSSSGDKEREEVIKPKLEV